MARNEATVARIRPVSWKICVQGREPANHVRGTLQHAEIECSEPIAEPELHDPPIYSFIASPKHDLPLTEPELQSLFDQDERIEVAFEAGR